MPPEDSLRAIQEKAAEYRLFGIENIWIIDPESRLACIASEAGLEQVRSGELAVPGTPIRISLSELFAELDED
jgi:Uma2 family endonuclease